MRVLLGLTALAAGASATTVSPNGPTTGSMAVQPGVGQTALTSISIRQQTPSGALASVVPSIASPPTMITSLNWVVTVPNQITAVSFDFVTNQFAGQMQYRWAPNYPSPQAQYPTVGGLSGQSYTCDPCAGSTAVSCNTATGPGATPSPLQGFACSNLARNYIISQLISSTPTQTVVNSFSMQLFDLVTNPAPNTSSYSFQIVRQPPAIIVGDPQIVGMQGQDFQVHGMPDEIFNMVSFSDVQVNARFTYLESAGCFDNYTTCFAHPGTYITEEGFRVGKDKVRVTAGSFKKGLTVHVNGKKVTSDVDLKNGRVEVVNHRRAVVHTSVMTITVTNSDKFMNQEMVMNKPELIELGQSRRVLKDNERFHPEIPLHGLQGQTWRNVEYPSGLEYEGSIMDYHVASGNIYGTDFVFNQFSS